MADTTYPTDTLLALDFGTATTRAMLFDVVEGSYRFVACGEAPTTVEHPYYEASEGMRHALVELQNITGRTLLDGNTHLLVMPATPDGVGVDAVAVTSSAGPAVKTLLVGLLPSVSVESARRLAGSGYLTLMDILSLGDRRRTEQQFDAVLNAQPELILVAGGTDNGSREALVKLLETVALACHLLPTPTPPKLLYAGNPVLGDKIKEMFGGAAHVYTAPNVQPELGEEVFGPARAELAKILEAHRLGQIGGFQDLAQMAGGRIYPTAQAEGQIVRYLNRTLNSPGGVLGVNVGSASTSVAAAFKNELYLSVRSDLGMGANVAALLNETTVEQVARWLPFEASATAVREFILNKSAHPHTLPADLNDLHLENAIAREVLSAGLRTAHARWPASVQGRRSDLLPRIDLILGSGAVLSRAPRPGVAALILLDALQPVGVTHLMLDPHHVTAALGAIAHTHPMTVVQALDSAFLSLGTVISPVGEARPGSVACRVKLVMEGGQEMSAEVKFGSLQVLPLPLGQDGKLTLKPRGGIDVGFGPGRGKIIPVTGGAVGVVIDARGRPIAFPQAAGERQELTSEWLLKVGGLV